MTSPNLLWNPRQVLQISEDGRCVGYAPSRGRKCRNVIAGHDLYKAGTLLECIAKDAPDANALRTKLLQLAEYSLCTRWHRPQARDMVAKWVERIELACPNSEVVESTRLRTSTPSRRITSSGPTASSSPSIASQRTASSTTSLLVPNHTERQSLEEIMADIHRTMAIDTLATATYRGTHSVERRSAERSYPRSRVSTRTSPIRSHIPTSNISASSLSLSSNSHPASSPSIVPPRASTSTPTSFTSVTQSRAPTSTSSSSTSTSRPRVQTLTSSPSRSTNTSRASTTSCVQPQVRHRAIDEECPICHEDFLSDDLIVWCKTQCGGSVHQECLETWQTQCVDSGRSVTCALCRAAWEEQSAIRVNESSRLCTRTHVRRLDVDDECPICQEDYGDDDSLVWCKDGCGRTVHRDCFRTWQEHLDDRDTRHTCAFCRKVWVSNCECES